ncbi:RDD family protein [bacterium]|nr:RDD family protein [bacterium]
MGKRYGEKLDLATSQNVVVELPLAGLGTRILANIIDTLIIYFAMIFIFIVANISNLFKYVEALPEWVIAILIILLFVLSWGYFPLWEFYGNGKTPGKRALKIRVRMDNGSPLTFSATLTRNLMRVADYLPYMYAIGVLAIIFNKKNKRLGDMVAGTVVITDQKFDLKRYMSEESNGIEAPTFKISGLSGIKLSHHTYETLDSFFQRKEKLPPEVRIRIVDNMLSGLALKNLPEGLPLKEKEAILYKIFTEGN